MHVWLVKFEETLPIDRNQRPYRMGMLAEALQAAGHRVTWWTSTYNYVDASLRFPSDQTITLPPALTLRLLHTVDSISKAVSIGRITNNFRQARRFVSATRQIADRPDIIVCAMPSPELASASASIGRRLGVPVVIDARDMWPDVLVDLLTPAKRILAAPYIAYIRHLVRSSCQRATAFTAITDPFLDWILKYASRPRNELDAAFPIGFPDPEIVQTNLDTAAAKLDQLLGPCWHANASNIVFMGRLNKTVAATFDHILQADQLLSSRNIPVNFIFAGTGDNADELRQRASGRTRILFTGHIDPASLEVLKSHAFAALLPIMRRQDYQISLSNKIFEYLGAGLPILSHLTGLPGQLLEEKKCGWVYDDGAQLAVLIAKITKEPTLAAEAGRRSREVFLTRFEAKKVYSDFSSHLARIAQCTPNHIASSR